MFKPGPGKCIECGKDRLIVVKKGYCAKCNDEKKRASKSNGTRGVSIGIENDDGTVLSNGSRADLEADDGLLPSCMDPKKKRGILGSGKRKGPIKVVRKSTGEWNLFLQIWGERKHVCQCCQQQLGDEPIPTFFSHILSKGAYVFFRLEKLNIMLKCPTCHHEWEFGDKSQEKFKLARMIADKLKRMYYERNKTARFDDAG